MGGTNARTSAKYNTCSFIIRNTFLHNMTNYVEVIMITLSIYAKVITITL